MKKLLSFLIFILVFHSSIAQVIDYEDAKSIAIDFFKTTEKDSSLLKSGFVPEVDTFKTYYVEFSDSLKSAKTDKTPAFYIINRNDKPGFVIVSGDERVRKIIAFSNSKNLVQINHGLQVLFKQYSREINYIKKADLSLSPINFDYTQKQYVVASWLLDGIEWDQSYAPYNNLCPETLYNGNLVTCPAGCVATAMAQIMRYHKYPRKGKGSHSYPSDYRTESADFQNTEYLYELMEESNPSRNNNAIAKLLYHCGVSVDMDYGPGGSSASPYDVESAFENHFDYSTGCNLKDKSLRLWSTWKEMIKTEIDNNNPIYYRAEDPDEGGHAFVLDGYRDDDTYHFNWGWSGDENDFYPLTLLDPDYFNWDIMDWDKFDFKNDHKMITGLIPANPDIKPPFLISEGYTNKLNTDIKLTFSEPIDLNSLLNGNLTVSGSKHGNYSILSPTYENDANTSTVIVKPTIDFQYNENITVTLKSSITDLVGNGFDGDGNGTVGPDYSFQFVTEDISGDLLVDGEINPVKNVTLNPGSSGLYSFELYNSSPVDIVADVNKLGSQRNWISLTDGSPVSISAGETKTYDFKITAPYDTEPGDSYTASILFSYAGTKTNEVFFNIKVIDFVEGLYTDNLHSGSCLIDGAIYESDTYLIKYDGNLSFYLDNDVDPTWESEVETSVYFTPDQYNRINSASWSTINAVENKGYGGIRQTIEGSGESYSYTQSKYNLKINILEWLQNGENTFHIGLNNFVHDKGDVEWFIDTSWGLIDFSKSAWGEPYAVSSNNINRWEDGWDRGRIYFDVDDVNISGDLMLFNNGKKISINYISSSDEGDREYFSISSDEIFTSNYFNIKGDKYDDTKVTISNIRLEVSYFDGEPNLYCTKSLSRNNVDINEEVTVNLSFHNIGSNIADDPWYNDSPLPEGFVLVSGSLRGDPGDLDPDESANESYTIKATQAGTYVFGDTNVDYENISGKNYLTQFNAVTLVVNSPVPSPPVAVEASDITNSGFTANWNSVENATGYYLDVALDEDFLNTVEAYSNLDVGNTTSFEIVELMPNTSYYYRVRAYNESLTSSNSNLISLQTLNQNMTLNVALSSNGGTASAISEGTYSGVKHYAYFANDEDNTSAWTSSWSMPAWLKIKFDKSYFINKVGVLWGIGAHNQDYSISLSKDGNNWTTVVPTRSSNTNAGYTNDGYHGNENESHELFDIEPVSAEYIKIDITKTSAPSSHIFKAVVHELEAYGKETNIPEYLQVLNTTITTGNTDCFNATSTITIAGDGTNVVVESGASAEFIAGQSIRFLPGFHAQEGSYVHGHITTTGEYCVEAAPAIVAAEITSEKEALIVDAKLTEFPEREMVVYPNPNNGEFTVEFRNFEDEIQVMLFNSIGQMVYNEQTTEKQIRMRVPNLKSGMYFIKAVNKGEQFNHKILVH